MIFSQLHEMGTILNTQNNQQTSVKSLDFKYLGLYFTADWCGACVRLAKVLPKMISQVNGHPEKLEDHQFKLISFRLDDTPSDFAENYYKFKANLLPQNSQFADMLSVQFLPTIYIYARDGRLVSTNGIRDMQLNRERTIEYWDTL